MEATGHVAMIPGSPPCVDATAAVFCHLRLARATFRRPVICFQFLDTTSKCVEYARTLKLPVLNHFPILEERGEGMRKSGIALFVVFAFFATALPTTLLAEDQNQPISTNKDRLLTIAAQGEIAPAEPSRGYSTTWDGKPKMMIGIGGINHNLKVGDYVFGPANGDRATVGVAVIGTGDERAKGTWQVITSIGNSVTVWSGKAEGSKGFIVGKVDGYVLVHYEDDVLDKLSIGDTLQAKASGIGLEIQGHDDVFAHGITPEILEKVVTQRADEKLEVTVVKEIPAEIVGQGPGRSSLSGNYNIQTCYPPDIEEYGLNELRYGDLVLLKNIQTDYGKGYFRGGATLGVVVTGPSDESGLGIGVTPILSNSFGKLTARIDPSANIGKHIGIEMKAATNPPGIPVWKPQTAPSPSTRPTVFKTNKDKLITTAVEGVVQPARGGSPRPSYLGKPKLLYGMGSVNYTVSVGDPAYGWEGSDHVEPGVTIQGRDRPSPSDCALAILACIGNEAKVISGKADGAKGLFIGRHSGSHDMVWFPKDALEKLGVNDKIQVRARGVGLKIEGFDDVRVNKMSPELLENMGITIVNGRLVVPIVKEVPGHIMGSGMGGSFLETGDYDIQTTCPEVVEELSLKDLRLGDIVAIRDHYDFHGRGRYVGAVTIGVIIHGWSDLAGHGPGVNPLLSATPGIIETKLDPDANTAYYLGIKEKP